MKCHRTLFEGGFSTPSGKVEFNSQRMAALGLDPLPSGESSVNMAGQGRFGLQLITPPRHQLTRQDLTDMGDSCAFHCNLVEVAPLFSDRQKDWAI